MQSQIEQKNIQEPTQTVDFETATDRIYEFIRQNGQVYTRQIIELEIVERRQVFYILKQLVNENKIEKVGHGEYRDRKTES